MSTAFSKDYVLYTLLCVKQINNGNLLSSAGKEKKVHSVGRPLR